MACSLALRLLALLLVLIAILVGGCAKKRPAKPEVFPKQAPTSSTSPSPSLPPQTPPSPPTPQTEPAAPPPESERIFNPSDRAIELSGEPPPSFVVPPARTDLGSGPLKDEPKTEDNPKSPEEEPAGPMELPHDPTSSPLGLRDAQTWNQKMLEFNAHPAAQTLAEFFKILYDWFIDRPWKDKYYPEADKRWKALRQLMCPAATHICALPEAFSSDDHLNGIVTAIGKAEVQKEFRDFMVKSQIPGEIDFIQYLPGSEIPLHILISQKRTVHEGPVKKIEVEWLRLQDSDTYLNDFFFGKHTMRFFALTTKNEILINHDNLKRQTPIFAGQWKFAMNGRERIEPKKVLNAPELTLLHLYIDQAPAFQRHHDLLVKKALTLPEAQAQKMTTYLAAARDQNEYVDEVYHHVSFELLARMIEALALSFHEKAGQSGPIDPYRQLVDLAARTQKAGSAKLFYYLLYRNLMGDENFISQVFDKRMCTIYAMKMVSAVLELDVFKGTNLYAKYRSVLENSDLLDDVFLTALAPELKAKLAALTENQPEKFWTLPEAKQKEFWKSYLFNIPDKEANSIRFRRLFQAIIIGLSEFEAQNLANQIQTAINLTGSPPQPQPKNEIKFPHPFR